MLLVCWRWLNLMNRTIRGRLERTLTSAIYTMSDDELLKAYALLQPCDNCFVSNCPITSTQYFGTTKCYSSVYEYAKESDK